MRCTAARAAMHEHQLLEQVHVLLVLEQRAVQGRQRLLRIVAAQRLGRMSSATSSLSQSSSSEVDGFFFSPGVSRSSKNAASASASSSCFSRGKCTSTMRAHRRLVREADVVEEAAPQEGVGQLLLVVAGDDHERPVPRRDQLAASRRRRTPCGRARAAGRSGTRCRPCRFRRSAAPGCSRLERLPQPALDDVVADVVHALIAELRIAQPRDRVVFVQSLLRLGGGFDVPLQQRPVRAPARPPGPAWSCRCRARP